MTDLISFLILAMAVFLLVKKVMEGLKKKTEEPVAAPALTKQEQLLTEIRDLLSKQQST